MKGFEYDYLFTNEKHLSITKQKNLSEELIKIIVKDNNLDKLELFFKNVNFIEIYEQFLPRIKDFILNEKSISFKGFLKNILYNETNYEIVKMALSMSPYVFLNEEERDILSKFKKDPAYVYYICRIFKDIFNDDKEIRNIARENRGYEKALCYYSLSLNYSDNMYYFICDISSENENINDFLVTIAQELNFKDFFENCILSNEDLKYVSKFFIKVLDIFDDFNIKDKDNVMKKLTEILKDSNDIFSLYCLIKIQTEYIEQSLFDIEKGMYCETIINNCKNIVKDQKWKKVLDSINIDDFSGQLLLECAYKTGYKFKYADIKKICDINFDTPLVYNYLLMNEDKKLRKYAFDLSINKLDLEKILSDPEDISLDKLTKQQSDYACFYIVISMIKYDDIKKKFIDINIKALNAHIKNIRAAAARNLCSISDKLTQDNKKNIKNIVKNEPCSDIKKMIFSIIKGIKVDVSFMDPEIHVKDIFLIRTKINNIISYVSSYNVKPKTDDFIYIVKDYSYIDNRYKILAADIKGRVLGCIEGEMSIIFSNLIDGGQTLYAVVNEIKNDGNYGLTIDVFLSYKYVLDQTFETISLISSPKEGLVQ